MIPRLRPFLALLVVAVLTAACSGDGDPSPSAAGSGTSGALDPSSFVVQVASSDLFVDAPQRLNVGVFANDPGGDVLVLTGGEIAVSIAPFESQDGPTGGGDARYLPAPGTDAPQGATLSVPAEARGVYEVADVTFDAPGVWEATARFTVDGEGPFEVAATPFNVLDAPAYPAPGDRALETENLTMDSDVDPASIDSGAISTGEVPDPELHEATIAEAVEQGRPVVALFATPSFCMSLFCGPVTTALQDLAAAYGDKAVFIHVEIWKDNAGGVLNEAAADWLYRNDDLTEPWLYLIDDRGRIVDRWAPLFDPDEVGAMLEQMPDMR